MKSQHDITLQAEADSVWVERRANNPSP